MEIMVRFLGRPKVEINSVPVELEQKKTQALLLYMLFNGSCTRDELAELLWCDYPGESARRNLRNSLYKLKTAVGKDLLVTKGHSFIRIAPEIVLHKDTDLFVTENSLEQMLALPSYTFLDCFYVKNCPEFENWVDSMRGVYEKMVLKRLTKELKRGVGSTERHVEACATRILEIDPFHEEACRTLMQIYIAHQNYAQAAACYTNLQSHLETELDIQPEPETRQLFQKILTLKQSVMMADCQSAGCVNQGAVQTLKEEYHAFRGGKPCRHCILSGDIGMGKSETIQEFLDGVNRSEVVSLTFQRVHHTVPYYAADRLAEVLSSWSGYRGERQSAGLSVTGSLPYFKFFEGLFQHLGRLGRRGVLVLHNLEAVDPDSMKLFRSYLWTLAPDPILIVGEYSPNFGVRPNFLNHLALLPQFRILQFPALDEEASIRYLLAQVEQGGVQEEQLKDGYAAAGGNLLLLREYVQNLDAKGQGPFTLSQSGALMMEELLASLSQEEYRQLELLAVIGGTEVEAVAEMMQQSPISVVQTLNALSDRGWICEREEGEHLLLKGRFGIIQDLIYDRMPRYKRMEFHRLAAEYYEERYLQKPKDLFYLTQVRDHYDKLSNPGKKINYNILHLEYILDYIDEFFPTITDDILRYQSLLIPQKDICARIEQYDNDLQLLEDELPPQQYYELRMKLDFLQGRAMIRNGKRDLGRVRIQRMMDMAKKLHRNDLLMKGYVETLCYSVRSENTELMSECIQLAQRIEGFEKYGKENGVLLRIQGYQGILEGRYEDAERCLWASVNVFEQPKLRSTNYYNLAAAYDYLSLSRRRQGKYDDSLLYIHKAIDLCVEKNVQKSLDLFYQDCGYTLFLKKEYAAAEQYFLKSIDLYERFDTYWLRSIAESGLAMIYTYRKDEKVALEHFRLAEVYSRKEMAQEEVEVLNLARKTLKEAHIL